MIPAAYDIQHAFDAHAVGAALALPALAAAPHARAILVGNSRAWWPHFLAHRRDEPDPIDRLVERELPATALFAHRPEPAYGGAAHRSDGPPSAYPDPDPAAGYLPFQRIAVAAGLGTLSPSQLVIHPTFGPWFALRAIVFEPGPTPTRTAPPTTCVCPDTACADAFGAASRSSDPFAWIAVRDACTHGRAHRYTDQQIRYHYGKRRTDLG